MFPRTSRRRSSPLSESVNNMVIYSYTPERGDKISRAMIWSLAGAGLTIALLAEIIETVKIGREGVQKKENDLIKSIISYRKHSIK